MTQAEIDLSNRREQDYSRSRRLDYSAALLRCIAAVQSSEWIHDLNKCRIVPITLDALVQVKQNTKTASFMFQSVCRITVSSCDVKRLEFLQAL